MRLLWEPAMLLAICEVQVVTAPLGEAAMSETGTASAKSAVAAQIRPNNRRCMPYCPLVMAGTTGREYSARLARTRCPVPEGPVSPRWVEPSLTLPVTNVARKAHSV